MPNCERGSRRMWVWPVALFFFFLFVGPTAKADSPVTNNMLEEPVPCLQVESGPAPDQPPPTSSLDLIRQSARAYPVLIPRRPCPEAVQWRSLFKQAGLFLGIQHGFRLMTEQGTRDGLMNGHWWSGYTSSVANLHGWADGDPFYVNYVGHPMQGSVAGYIWVQNDPRYRQVEFGKNRDYWKSRLRAAAFSWAYSEQFEIGPLSEASIGRVQSQFPQTGFVDHVITPVVGLGWMLAEDSLDRYVIRPLELRVENPYVRMMARSWLNPTRSFANMMRGKTPWYRDTRSGIFTPEQTLWTRPADPKDSIAEPEDRLFTPAPIEVTTHFEAAPFLGGRGVSCAGGGGEVAFRISSNWQAVMEVGGCKMNGLETNLSGDSLTYTAGPRWRYNGTRWSSYLEVMAGGQKVTHERFFPERKAELERIAKLTNQKVIDHEDYTTVTESSGFSIGAGGGVDLKLNRALALRVASLEYRKSWIEPIDNYDHSQTLRFSTGLILRMGTW